MGQYYKPMNLDRREWLYSHDYDNGLKLMEHSWRGNDFVNQVENLLRPENPWYKTRIVWAGDYMDDGLFMTDEDKKIFVTEDNVYNLYQLGFDHNDDDEPEEMKKNAYRKITPMYYTMNYRVYSYLTNHTRKEYVDYNELVNKEGFVVNPLPLLTCSGNGRGGGDYHGVNEDKVGRWAGDQISFEREKPEGYVKLEIQFMEKE